MTFREKFGKEGHPRCPGFTAKDIQNAMFCPLDLGYEQVKVPCPKDEFGAIDCDACWNREMPKTKPAEILNKITEEESKKMNETTQKSVEELKKEIVALQEQLKRNEEYAQLEKAARQIKMAHDAFMNAGFTSEQAFEILKLAFDKCM